LVSGTRCPDRWSAAMHDPATGSSPPPQTARAAGIGGEPRHRRPPGPPGSAESPATGGKAGRFGGKGETSQARGSGVGPPCRTIFSNTGPFRNEATTMDRIDLAVVGAGPCGIAVGAAAREAGLSAVLFDEGCVANSIVNYPYYMRFFSTADRLEVGGVPFPIPEKNPSRREALVYYRRVVQHFALDVRQYEKVESISGVEGAFVLRTQRTSGREGAYQAGRIVMATGGFHAPNLLGVPGEDLPKVHHFYKEAHPFFNQDVLVVGGSNSAVEASLELFRAGARVTLVHFLDSLDRGVKPWVLPDITNRLQMGDIGVYWKHRVSVITPEAVKLREEETGETVEIPNDWVLAMTGWRSDPALLRELGVTVDEATGIPSHDPQTMETDVPGVFIAGVLAAGNDANKIFIENGRSHGGLVVGALCRRDRPQPVPSGSRS
jgi:thioredoxin reductase (NADPH)